MRPEHRSRSEAGRSVGELGELGVLARIAGRVGPIGDDVVIGIGDDTAAVTVAPGALVLITTDALVEDVHFRRTTSVPADVGWKALAINASDIAAMGGEPRAAVISLMLPPALDAAWVDGLYDGLMEMAANAAVAGPAIAIVGGNLAQAPLVIVDVALIGEVQPDRVIRRTG
ncbi:MAG: thiamine-phosphate kinase, partial [Armatimonadota bacterium]